MNIRLKYNEKEAIVRNDVEAIDFIESLGFEVNDVTFSHIKSLFNSKLEKNHFEYYFTNGFYKVRELKPKGIGNGSIRFFECEYDNIEDFVKNESLKNEKYDAIDSAIAASAKEYMDRLDGNNTFYTHRIYSLIDGDKLSITLGFNLCYSNVYHRNIPLEEITYHISYDTLTTDEGKHIEELFR